MLAGTTTTSALTVVDTIAVICIPTTTTTTGKRFAHDCRGALLQDIPGLSILVVDGSPAQRRDEADSLREDARHCPAHIIFGPYAVFKALFYVNECCPWCDNSKPFVDCERLLGILITFADPVNNKVVTMVIVEDYPSAVCYHRW